MADWTRSDISSGDGVELEVVREWSGDWDWD